MKYFTLDELTRTNEQVDNRVLSWNTIRNLAELSTQLDRLREMYGEPIVVTSGYRCQRLNEIVGGVKNSLHKYGLAADIRPELHPAASFRYRLEDLNKCIKAMGDVFTEVVYHSTYTHVAIE